VNDFGYLAALPARAYPLRIRREPKTLRLTFIEQWFLRAAVQADFLRGWRVPAVDDVFYALGDDAALDVALQLLGAQRGSIGHSYDALLADVRALSFVAQLNRPVAARALRLVESSWLSGWICTEGSL
jgi:hypothetical protein